MSLADTPSEAASPSSPTAQTAPKDSQISKVQNLLDSKRFAEALSDIEFLLKSEPKNPDLLRHKGFALRETGKLAEAITALMDALKIKPDLHKAKEDLAVTYLRMGEIKPAQQLYKELKKEAPDLAARLAAEAKKLKIKL
jgi:Flp pilus assembly protein TadD